MTNYERVITATAKKLNLTKAKVDEIYKTQFKFVADSMKDNLKTQEDRPIRLPYFGTFIVKPKRRKCMNSNQLTKKDEEI